MIELVATASRWPKAPLGELCDIRGGYPAPQAESAWQRGGIPFVRMKDVGRLHWARDLHKTEAGLAPDHFALGRYVLTPAGSILMPRSGSVGLNHRAILTTDAVIVSHLCALVPRPGKILTPFLYWFLCLADMRKLTKKTTGLDSISFSDLRQVAVPVPPVTEQERIAGVLDRIETLTAKRRQALAGVDRLIGAMFIETFGDPVTNPHGWPRRRIGDLGRVVTGNTPPRGNASFYGHDVEWIKSDNLSSPSHYATVAHEWLSEAGKAVGRTVPAGSVLVTCIAGSPESIGNVAMTDREVAFNQQINAIVPENVDARFIYTQLRIAKPLIRAASTASMKGMVSKSRFEAVLLMAPPVELQRAFARRFDAVGNAQIRGRTSLIRLESLFATLHQAAFRGDL